MNREIRFQVVENNKIVAEESSDPQFNGGAWCHYLLADPEQIIRYGGYVQMGFTTVIRRQFTGLKDKNSNEIYEGDIVRLTCECGYTENGSVKAKDGYNGYYVETKYQHDWPNGELRLAWPERGTEAIGNIWEHPELLEAIE